MNNQKTELELALERLDYELTLAVLLEEELSHLEPNDLTEQELAEVS